MTRQVALLYNKSAINSTFTENRMHFCKNLKKINNP